MAKKIWINVPSYTGTVHAGMMSSLVTEVAALTVRGDHVEIRLELGSPLISDTRGIMVEKFLEGDADVFVFIDHDISEWTPGALARLIDKPVDVCAGIYPFRRDPIEYPIRWDTSKPDLRAVNGLLEVHGVPAGFMVISREALERMREAYKATLDVAWGDVRRGAYCAMFEPWWGEDGPTPGSRLKYGDDYAFCERWRAIGGKIWIDPEISFGHTGNKTFKGCLGESLRLRMQLQGMTHEHV